MGQSYVDISGSSRVRGFSDATETQSISSVLVPGTGVEAISPGDAAETEIDLEYAGGIVPAANLLLVHVGSDLNYDVFDALAFSIDQNVAPVISISYGICEALLSATELQQGNALFQQATVQGQTLVAASGDSGSTGCVRFGTSSFLSTLQQQALAVGYPADSPYVTAVGGTQMAAGTFAAGETTYWAASTFGFDLQTSLLSYVPEVAWNEGNTQRIFAGGGGASSVFSRPTWQSGLQGITEGVTRLLPDVALQASSGNPGFLLCTDDASFLASEGQTIGCFEGLRGDNGQFTVGGGTSFGAPVFAAMTALINQQQHTIGQGNVNPTLYGIAAKSSTDSSAFHDIVSGSIACFPGAPRCSAAGQSGFSANAGYDEATGLGSIDFGRLAAAWPSKQGPTLSGSLIQVFPQNTTSDPGATDGLSINVSPDPFTNGTAPTGSVLITLDGVTIAPALALSPMQVGNSTAEYVVTLPSSPGSHVIVVTYPGDATHGPSSAAVSVLVGDVFASGGITVTAGDLTVPRNSTAATTVTVTPNGGYNGRLFWSLSLAGADNQGIAACYFIPDVVVQGITTTTLSLGSGTVCSTASAAANASFRALPVHRAANTAPAKLWGSASIATAVLGCFLLPLARRRSLPILCMLLISIGGVALSGCGGGSNPASSSNPGGSSGGATPAPTATTYTATLTGRDSINGVITASATFALTLR